jgi:predicted RND superfamily exporter protein
MAKPLESLHGRATALLARLVKLQIERPLVVLAFAAVSVAASLFLASKLSLKTSFGELLPANKESVIVADKVNERLASISTMGVVIEGSDNEGLKRFVDALAPKIREIGPPLVGLVDEGVQESKRFFEERAFLYADVELVQEVHDEIVERYEYEVGKKAGLLVDDEHAPPPISEESIKKRLRERNKKEGDASAEASAEQQFPDGYYLQEGKHVAVILVRTPIGAGDLEQTAELKSKIMAAADALNPASFDPAIKIGFGGNLISSAATRETIESDLKHVGVWGVALILGVVFLYYLRIRTLIAMAFTVGIGTLWTFALAYLLVGYLNSSSGFLVSIVVGNGINFGIILMARYMEARRDGCDSPEAIRVAHRETWLSTLAAAFAALCAYGALVVTDFRGFKHFGIIGGSGMLLCWCSTYLFMPAIMMVIEKILPLSQPTGIIAKVQGAFGRPFAFLASRAPGTITAISVLLTLGSGVLAYRYIAEDPMEYNMNRVGNDPVEAAEEVRRLGTLVDETVGRQGMDGIAVATDSIDQVLPLKEVLEARRDAAPEGQKPFKDVITIHTLLPTNQEPKLALIKDALSYIENAHKKRFMSDEEYKKVTDLLPPDRIQTIGIADLPEQVARHFTEKDGTRGRLVYITPAAGESVWDGHYLIRWAEAIRHTELPDASVVKGSGRSVVFADMIINVIEDAPKVIIASLLLTLAVVLIAFRATSAAAWAMGSLLMALIWMAAILMVFRSEWPWGETGKFVLQPLKLNFLNFVTVPITIGVGADYAVNMMERHRLAGGEMKQVVVETGGAVILCACTTILGYVALTLSINRAVQSFGFAAAAGEICCMTCGTLVLPSVLQWLSERKKRGGGVPETPAGSGEKPPKKAKKARAA